MKSWLHMRKEAQQLANDPFGVVVALLLPLAIVFVYSLLELSYGPEDFGWTFRDTHPAAMVLTLGVWLSSLTLASTAFYRDRINGTLERLSTTQFNPFGLVIGKSGVLYGVILLQVLILWGVTNLLLPGVMSAADPRQGILALTLLGFAGVSIGMVLSALTTSTTQALSLVTFLALASLALSGFLKPLDDMGTIGMVARWFPYSLGYQTLMALMGGAPLGLHQALALGTTAGALVPLGWLFLRLTGRRPGK
jgi:ABC-type transport system involved in cytochrome c biogenesis permease component